MRLLVDGDLKPAGGIIGAGFDELRWPRPVRAGDELRVESEVLEVRQSKSRPDQGLIKVRMTTLNQNDEAVQVFVGQSGRAPPSSHVGKITTYATIQEAAISRFSASRSTTSTPP
jgi:acyl dehydratase